MESGQAFLTGIISGVVVVVGVVLAETLSRVRNRRELILDRIQELNIVLPKYLASFTRRQGFPSPSDPEFPALFERVLSCLADIRFNARSPLRGHAEIREKAEDLTARAFAALSVWEKGGALSVSDMANIGVNSLRRAVLGTKHQTLDHLIKQYEKDGFPLYPEDLE